MLNRDHSLTEDGINQALSLNAQWKLVAAKDARLSGEGAGPQVIDVGRLNEEDLRAVESGANDDDDSDGEGPSSSGASKGTGKGLSKLYDTFFQKHSSVTVAGKARDSKPAAVPAQPGMLMFLSRHTTSHFN